MAVFGKSDDDKGTKVMTNIINRVNENIRRLRIMEQKMEAIDARIDSAEQNIMGQTKNFQKSLEERDMKMTEVDERLMGLETTTKEILKQLRMVATKSKVEELKELIEIYNPLKSSFVTKEELENAMKGRESRV